MRNLYIATLLGILIWGFFSCNFPINNSDDISEEMDIEDEYLPK